MPCHSRRDDVTPRVLITVPHLQRAADEHRRRLEERGIEIELPDVRQQLSEDELVRIIGRFDGVIAGDDPFSARVLANGERLQVISKWGVGTDNIDLNAARAKGILVTNTPGALGAEVADVVVGYLVLLARKLHHVDALVRAGEWAHVEGQSLSNKTLAVVGLGAIGRAVTQRAMALEMRVIGHDVSAKQAAGAAELGVRLTGFDDLLGEADFLSLNCNLTPENHHLIGAAELRRMKRTAFVINTSRGRLIDEAALADALVEDRIAGAALDVFEREPLPEDSPLRAVDRERCVFGSHNGSNTREAVRRVSELAIDNLLEGLARQAAS